MLIEPITAQTVRPEYATQVVVPSFDALSEDDKDAIRLENPLSFLHAMHSPEGSFEAALDRSKAGLERLKDAGVFGEHLEPVLFVYRMTHPRGAQTGLVCSIPAARFDRNGEVLPHEAVQPDLVDYLARYHAQLGVSSSPVKAAFRSDTTIGRLLGEQTARSPMLHFGDASDLQQEIWAITDPGDIAAFVHAFGNVDRAYITDGHHRSAAALHISPEAPVLIVLFPDHHLFITQFNRVVRDVPLEPLRSWLLDVDASASDEPPNPLEPGSVGVFVDGVWHRASLPSVAYNPPSSLDPSVLQAVVLGPILGIENPSADARVQFVPGSVPLDALELRAGDGAAFALAPVSVADVMSVADRGLAMPAKSTYFEPKARSGVFLMRY